MDMIGLSNNDFQGSLIKLFQKTKKKKSDDVNKRDPWCILVGM